MNKSNEKETSRGVENSSSHEDGENSSSHEGGGNGCSSKTFYCILFGIGIIILLFYLLQPTNKPTNKPTKKPLKNDHKDQQIYDLSNCTILNTNDQILEWENEDSIVVLKAIVQNLQMLPIVYDGHESGTARWYGDDLYQRTGFKEICVTDFTVLSKYPEENKKEFLSYTVKKEISPSMLILLIETLGQASFWYDRLTMELTVRSYRHGNAISLLYVLLLAIDAKLLNVKDDLANLLIKKINETKMKETSSGVGVLSKEQVAANIKLMEEYIQCSVGRKLNCN